MSVKQTISIKDNSGSTYSTAEELVSKLTADVTGVAPLDTFVQACTDNGSVVTEDEVVFPGNKVIITRMWADDKWSEFLEMDGPDSATFETAGWTIESSDDS